MVKKLILAVSVVALAGSAAKVFLAYREYKEMEAALASED